MGCYTLLHDLFMKYVKISISSWHSSTSITGLVLLHQQNFLQSNPAFVLARVLHIKFAQPRTQRTNGATWIMLYDLDFIEWARNCLEVPKFESILHHQIHNTNFNTGQGLRSKPCPEATSWLSGWGPIGRHVTGPMRQEVFGSWMKCLVYPCNPLHIA